MDCMDRLCLMEVSDIDWTLNYKVLTCLTNCVSMIVEYGLSTWLRDFKSETVTVSRDPRVGLSMCLRTLGFVCLIVHWKIDLFSRKGHIVT